MRNCSSKGYSNLEADKVIISEKGEILASIGKILSGETFVSKNFEENPEAAIVENLNLKEMDIPAFKIKLEKFHLDYRDKKLEFAMDNISAPGAVLELVDIPNAPEEIKGSITGSGKLRDNICNGSIIVEFPGLFSLVASFEGTNDIFPAQLDFILANDGISDYMTAGQKSDVELFGKLIPEGDVAIQGLLSSAGKILLGSLEEKGEEFKFTYTLK